MWDREGGNHHGRWIPRGDEGAGWGGGGVCLPLWTMDSKGDEGAGWLVRSLAPPNEHRQTPQVDRGDWVGLSMEEIGAGPWAEWNARPDYRQHNGEALADVATRVLAAKNTLLEKSPWGSTTALTSHMWVTRSILAEALGYDTVADTSKLESIDIPTASISVVEYPREGPPNVVYMGVKPAMLEASVMDKEGLS